MAARPQAGVCRSSSLLTAGSARDRAAGSAHALAVRAALPTAHLSRREAPAQQPQSPPPGSEPHPLDALPPDIARLVHHWPLLPDDSKATLAHMAVFTLAYMQGRAAPPSPLRPLSEGEQSGDAPADDQGDDEAPQPELHAAAPGAPSHRPDLGLGIGAEHGAEVAPRAVALLLALFASNNHTICDEELRPLGMGLYPLAALANHSCNPSCMQSFHGRTITFRALRPIAAGDEITIAYVELAATRRERRQELLQRYHFDIDAADGDDDEPDGGGAAIGDAGMHDEEAAAASVPQAAAARGRRLHVDDATTLVLYDPPSRGAADTGNGGSRAPWREDPIDPELTRMVVASPACGGPPAVLAGGMTACLLPAQREDAAVELDAEEGAEADGGAAPGTVLAVSKAQRSRGGAHSAAGAGAVGSAGPAAAVLVEAWGQQWAAPGEAPDCDAPAADGGGAACADVAATAARLAELLRLQAHGERLTASGRPTEACSALQGALALADAPPPAPGWVRRVAGLGPMHVLRLRLQAAVLKAAVDAGDRWPAALEAARALAPVYQAVYPKVWPNLGLHYALLAKLELLLGNARQARTAAEAALESLSITHRGTGVLQEVLRLRWEAQQDLGEYHE